MQVKEAKEIQRIMRLGYKYAHRLHSAGSFDRFDTSRVKYERVRRPSSLAASPAASMDAGDQFDAQGSAGPMPQRA